MIEDLKELYMSKREVIRSSFLGDHYVNQEGLTAMRKDAEDAQDDVWNEVEPMCWVVSSYEEDFSGYGEEYSTKEEAIAANMGEAAALGESCFYVGRKIPAKDYTQHVTADSVIEEMQMAAEDDTGMGFDTGYLENVPAERVKELEQELRKVVSAWVEKYNYKPTFFEVVEVEKVEVNVNAATGE